MKHCGSFRKEALVLQNQSQELISVHTPQNSRTVLYAVWSLSLYRLTSTCVFAQICIDYPQWAQASLQIHAWTALLAVVVIKGNGGNIALTLVSRKLGP